MNELKYMGAFLIGAILDWKFCPSCGKEMLEVYPGDYSGHTTCEGEGCPGHVFDVITEKDGTYQSCHPENEQRGKLALIPRMERFFNRKLSQMEREEISSYAETVDYTLIEQAAKYAGANQKGNIRYVKAIVNAWMEKGIDRYEAEAIVRKHLIKKDKKKQQLEAERDTSVYFDWLGGEAE